MRLYWIRSAVHRHTLSAHGAPLDQVGCTQTHTISTQGSTGSGRLYTDTHYQHMRLYWIRSAVHRHTLSAHGAPLDQVGCTQTHTISTQGSTGSGRLYTHTISTRGLHWIRSALPLEAQCLCLTLHPHGNLVNTPTTSI